MRSVWSVLGCQALVMLTLYTFGDCPVREELATTATRQYQSMMFLTLCVAPLVTGMVANMPHRTRRETSMRLIRLDRFGAFAAPGLLSLFWGLVGITNTLP